MSQVHAPYHFVPLSRWVYSPEWAHMVNHDHPFTDGIDGIIEFDLTNLTPLLVGAEAVRADENKPTCIKWSRDPEDNPVIPGSSLKGMLRNVLEIACFGKFSETDDPLFSFRDISNRNTHYSKILQDSTLETGWLKYDSSQMCWTLTPCQHTVLFNDDLERYTHIKINNASHSVALKKYEDFAALRKKQGPILPFSLTERGLKGTKGVPCATGSLQGYPVFVGYRPGKSEYFNYLFYGAETEAQRLNTPEDTHRITRMFEAHNEQLVSYLKEKAYPQQGIPLFIRRHKQSRKILAMGLAKMPRMPYERSVDDLILAQQKAMNSTRIFDLPGLMFGTLSDSGFSLKSRVYIGDALCCKNTGISQSAPVILGQPRASYLNAYLEQSDTCDTDSQLNEYKDSSRVSGWKRYPAQADFRAELPNELKKKVNVQSELELMQPGGHFTGRIVFHNLLPVELGALLWAITPFIEGRNNSAFCHGLGHGKSLGAGAIQLNARLGHNRGIKTGVTEETLKELFIEHMNNVYPSETCWEESPQIKHLLAFGDREDNRGKDLRYMPLYSPKDDSSVMSYTRSVRGRIKDVLPAWRHGSETLTRAEPLKDPKTPIGKGRLADLLLNLPDDVLSNYEKQAIQTLRQARKETAIQAERDAASEPFRCYLQLCDDLSPYNGQVTTEANNKRQGAAGDIERMLMLIKGDSSVSLHEWEQIRSFTLNLAFSGFIDLCVKPKDLSKKSKESFNRRKALLQELQMRFCGTEVLS